MDFAHTFFTFTNVIQLLFLSAHSQHDDVDFDKKTPHKKDSTSEEIIHTDNYSFVALLDILFVDGSKRTCTGTIIHDSVVITAAHCFTKKHDKSIGPELTASFVVIGTKKMFETGYEQYLPIERVILHPDFRGWTADLALVYTFSGMMSDKPGKVVPLAGKKLSTSVDSNVTVLSWGSSNADKISQITSPPENDKSEDSHNSCEKGQHVRSDKHVRKGTKAWKSKSDQSSSSIEIELRTGSNRQKSNSRVARTNRNKQHKQQTIFLRHGKEQQRTKTTRREIFDKITKNLYLSSVDESDDVSYMKHDYAPIQNPKESQQKSPKINPMSYFKNWRRHLGSQKNKLTVEVFGLVNVQTCKKLVEKAMPIIYELRNGNEYVCYSSEDHYITDSDSGAPAMSRGRLLAVTVGGAEHVGDHIAVGMKMTCFCPWIAENIPNSEAHMKCCTNCCDIKHTEDQKVKEKKSVRHRTKKYYSD